jgi:transcriptional regulator with XRE-family HTH domain
MRRNREASEIDAHVGARLRRRRLLAGVSQTELAKAAGVSFQQVQKYENGTNRIGAGRLFVFARFLGTRVAEFNEGLPGTSLCDGAPPNGDLQRVETFICSEEGLRLNLDYLRIDDRRFRKCVLDLLSFANGR